MLTKFIVVIFLQYTRKSNHHVVHLKLYNVMCQLYLNKLEKKEYTEKDIPIVLKHMKRCPISSK